MLIDVQDADLNFILNGCFFAIVALTVLSVIPWPLRDRRNRWTLVLPWLAVGLYIGYEAAMPTRMNIRLDLLMIWPLIGVAFLAWFVRLMRIRWLRKNKA